jgi:hypothetical protein
MEGSSISKHLGTVAIAHGQSPIAFVHRQTRDAAREFKRSLTRGKTPALLDMRSCVVFMPRVMPPNSRFSYTRELTKQITALRHKGNATCASKSFWLAPVDVFTVQQ